MTTASLQSAKDGHGPLLQRDYWAVLAPPVGSASELMNTFVEQFETFPPPDLMRFSRCPTAGTRLEPGDEMEVHIRLAGQCRVRVVHRDSLSVTLMPLLGHPEAGRITFGAYPNTERDVVFHIRSRARARSRSFRLGASAAGNPMQITAWTGFINRVAATLAAGVRDVIHVDTQAVEETEADRCVEGPEPTFRAVDREDEGS